MDSSTDRRTQARHIAMQALYQLDVQGPDFIGQLDLFINDFADDDLVKKLARQWSYGTYESLVACDALISAAAIKWDMSRLSPVDKAILRLAAYQMKFCEDIPRKVVINEAIEIAKTFSGQQSPRFVNGVLDAILRNISRSDDRPSELK